ncbi:phosphomethylpyrimidine synthase [Candidatus Micrarchaeota archaeon CG08_land_8_20_14_0_20_59_11]|nr:MAG: phosphomethylpyrimidine synthase [Candidatus Micrarchaeota archaeon CG08_land_8_20_14_0_20_59_11]PIT85283.1 MAG: phosphomethylpyrimidine synthase [Candidatus Micrarchaeota archaeon CG10_big_fil_rev_8_21_14_0_10_59_7]
MELKKIARNEGVSEGFLRRGIAAGRIVAMGDCAVGAGLRTKTNANLGCSEGFSSLKTEMEKAEIAVKYGADALMDLSVVDVGLRARLRRFGIPVGTVPVYDTFAKKNPDADDFFNAVERHCKDVDFVTVHCGITKNTSRMARKRLIGVVSRGGALTALWMAKTGNENPFYAEFDYLLEMLKDNGVALSLGDALRPGALADADDAAQEAELRINGALVKRARKAGVAVFVEGPGHMPLHKIAPHVRHMKKVCGNAPYYVLGPLVTDLGAGHDHITAAIGGAIAGAAGADFLCYVTPSEHLSFPDKEDVREGVIAARIAAHAADVAKGIPGARKQDDELSKARAMLDWKTQFALSFDTETCVRYRRSRPPACGNVCSMCGEYCAVKAFNEARKEAGK